MHFEKNDQLQLVAWRLYREKALVIHFFIVTPVFPFLERSTCNKITFFTYVPAGVQPEQLVILHINTNFH